MKPILIGSRALAVWDSNLKIKASTDWDVISDAPIEGCEFHDVNFLNNRIFDGYAIDSNIRLPNGDTAKVLSPIGLAIVKRSHLWRDLSFDKHITHYHKHGLADQIKLFSDSRLVVYDLEKRITLTKKEFPQGNPNLMQTKEDFFNDAVEKKYDHDYLHELVAFYQKPLYTKLLRDNSLAWCDLDKWNKLSHEDQVKCVAEETLVIAMERFMIPNNWNYPSKLAFMKALKKVCTTLTSGWFRDKAIDSYPEVMLQYNDFIFNKVESVLTKQVNK